MTLEALPEIRAVQVGVAELQRGQPHGSGGGRSPPAGGEGREGGTEGGPRRETAPRAEGKAGERRDEARLPPPRRGSRPAAPARWQRWRRAPAAVTQLHCCPRRTAGSERRRRSAASGSARSSSPPGANSSANLPRPGRGIPPPPPGAACSDAGDAARQCPPLARRPSALCPPAAARPRAATARGEAERRRRSVRAGARLLLYQELWDAQSKVGKEDPSPGHEGSGALQRVRVEEAGLCRGEAGGAAALLGQERCQPGGSCFRWRSRGPRQPARAGLLR